MSAQGSGTGTVGGTRAGNEPEQAGPSFGDNSFFVEFFGGVSFDGPCTLGDLLKSDEPSSPGTTAANERWLQMPHPDHFFKETDGFAVEDSSRSLPPPATSSSPTAALTINRAYNRAASDARGTRNNAQIDAGSARDGKENMNGKDPVRERKRRQSTIAKGVATKGDRAGGGLGRGNTRRRATRRTSAVMSSLSSSVPRADTYGSASSTAQILKDKDQAKNDPMKKKLEEYKRGVRTASSTPAGLMEWRVREGCGGAKTSSTAAASRNRGTSAVAARKTPSTSSRGGLGVAGTAPAVPSVGAGTAAAKPSALARGTTSANSRGASSESSTKNVSLMKRVSGSARTVTKITTINAPAKYVSRPIRTVKRSVNDAAAGRGRGRDRASVGEHGRGREVGCRAQGPVKRKGNGPVGGCGGRFGVGNRGKFATRSCEPALVLDAELEARLAAHNKGVTKGKHTYEPKRSIRDCRMWEAKTGKVYMSLTVDERIEANKEIDAMRAAIRDEAFAGH